MTALPAVDAPLLGRWERKLRGQTRAQFILMAALASVALSVFAFAPSLWQFREPAPGSAVWARGLGFLRQCEEPLRGDIEPALRWRLLPPFLAHVLHLRGWAAFAFAWAGILALQVYVASALERRMARRVDALFGVVLVGTTSAVVTPIAWLGVNDGWLWLAVGVAALGRSRCALPLACLLGPWVDDRFIIAFPCVLAVRLVDRGERTTMPHVFGACVWLLPYAIARLLVSRLGYIDSNGEFLAASLQLAPTWLPYAPLGWWFGLRAGWAILATALIAEIHAAGTRLLLAGTFLALLASTILAADLSRSTAILLPVLLLGCVKLADSSNGTMPLLGLAALANLVLPTAHVVFRGVQPVWPLPVELYRCLRDSL